MEFRILGPLEVLREGDPIRLRGPRLRALLAILLLHRNEVVSRDQLIEDVWAGRPPANARELVWVHVSRLRKALGGDALVSSPPGYVLRVQADELDLARFERLIAEAREAEPAVASERLRKALSLWRGSPLADVRYEQFATAEIARLEELRLAALEARIDADLALGRHAEIVGELEALVAQYPLRERMRAQLMLALYRSGRQAEALTTYQHARRALVGELGLEPAPELQRLERAILAQDPTLEVEGSSDLRRHEPPVAAGPILAVAREPEVERLLTIAEPLASSTFPRELVVARVLSPTRRGDLGRELARLREQAAAASQMTVRVAAFTSADPGRDIVRFASQQNVELMLIDADLPSLPGGLRRGELKSILSHATCDVAVVVNRDAVDERRGDRWGRRSLRCRPARLGSPRARRMARDLARRPARPCRRRLRFEPRRHGRQPSARGRFDPRSTLLRNRGRAVSRCARARGPPGCRRRGGATRRRVLGPVGEGGARSGATRDRRALAGSSHVRPAGHSTGRACTHRDPHALHLVASHSNPVGAPALRRLLASITGRVRLQSECWWPG